VKYSGLARRICPGWILKSLGGGPLEGTRGRDQRWVEAFAERVLGRVEGIVMEGKGLSPQSSVGRRACVVRVRVREYTRYIFHRLSPEVEPCALSSLCVELTVR
jgi:hypothetical protein